MSMSVGGTILIDNLNKLVLQNYKWKQQQIIIWNIFWALATCFKNLDFYFYTILMNIITNELTIYPQWYHKAIYCNELKLESRSDPIRTGFH